ncbi:hypothetical protein [Haloglomus litoreum]|uniref:hypothetical protein n=1 Tax=Haloglomus litoreum TaxID=3034026 RepID=UPI0023E864C1|nr:hypothetical protein [Haloglomus sp. DT116]
MERDVHVRKVETVPEEASVFHYDELDEGFKQAFPSLVEGNGGTVHESATDGSVSEGDCVKFTDYYCITRS